MKKKINYKSNNYINCNGLCNGKIYKTCINHINKNDFINYDNKYNNKYLCDYCVNELKIKYKVKYN